MPWWRPTGKPGTRSSPRTWRRWTRWPSGGPARRRDIRIDDEPLFALYDDRIPADAPRPGTSTVGGADLAHPARSATFTPDQLIASGAKQIDATAYPDTFSAGDVNLGLDYVFEPGRADDGVTVTIPLAVLARIDPAAFDAQVPGHRRDLAVALIKSLPKSLRRNFVPAPDFAAAALSQMSDGDTTAGATGLAEALAARLTALTGVVLRADFDQDKIPDHLRMGFRVVDESGRAVAEGKDLAGLQRKLQGDSRQAVAKASARWNAPASPHSPRPGSPGRSPAWCPASRCAATRRWSTNGRPAAPARSASRSSCRRSAAGDARRHAAAAGAGREEPLAHVRNGLSRQQMLTLTVSPYAGIAALLADATEAAVDALLDWAGGPAYTAAGSGPGEEADAAAGPAVLDIVVAAEAPARRTRRNGRSRRSRQRSPSRSPTCVPSCELWCTPGS
ncbi:MAG: DUF3418 domain-containing protein [Nakamurella sp.]